MKIQAAPEKIRQLKSLLRIVIPGVKGKLAIITGLFVSAVLIASAFFTYLHEGKLLEESLERETESALIYINGVVMEMDNVRNNILLIETMRLHIEQKQKEMQAFKYWYYRKSDSMSNSLKSLGRRFGMKLSYDYQLASADTYYSVYLSDAQMKAVEKSLLSRLKRGDGTPVSEGEFKELQRKARYVAAVQTEIDRYDQITAENGFRISQLNTDKKANAEEIARLEKENAATGKMMEKLHRSRQYADRIFRSQLKSYYEYELRRMEELGLLRGTIRVLTFDRYGDITYDTGSFNRETLTRFGDLTGNENYSKERNSYFAQAEKTLAVDKRADYNYVINSHSFHVRYIPVYRNPATFKRIDLILPEIQKRGSIWKSFLKEDSRIASSFAALSSQMRTRLADLRKAGMPPSKDSQYADLNAKYRDLLAEREKLFARMNPFRAEPERIAEDYSRRKKALREEILVSEKKIDALAKSPKKKEDIAAETEKIRSEISETRAQITALDEGEKLDREDIGRSAALSAADAFRTIREAALLDFSIMRQKNDASMHRNYLRSPEARDIEQKRWNALRSWIFSAKSETDIPESIPGTKIPLLDGGVLAYSRTEAEEYMWKIDAMPIADVIGFFGVEADISGLLGSLLSRNEMGYNAVLIDKTDGLAQIDASRRMTIIITALIAILAVIATYFIAGFMARRITMISEKARMARGGNLEITFPENGMDEIADMGISLNAMIEGLKEREELKGELSAAGEIQKQILPETIPDTLEGEYSIGRLYTSMMGVGGDYYDFIELEKDKLLFCIGDVSNHGVGPAMVMAMVRAHLHGIVKSGERDLAKILLELNQRIFRETPPQIFVTFFIGIVDGAENTITYCSAGHLKPIIYRHRKERIERLEAGGLPLGMDDNDFFSGTITVRTTQIKPGDFFFQFTDGLSEAKNSSRELFTEERLEEEVAKAARKKMDIAVRMIGTAVGEFAGKDLFTPSGMTDLDDDCALIAIKRLK